MSDPLIRFKDVSKFYGEVLGINQVTLNIEPGITSLVGPNGSGKTTLMNLVTGLLQPSQGTIHVLGISPGDPEQLFRQMGYCSQWDSFPRAFSGRQFLYSYLLVHGHPPKEARQLTEQALERVGLVDAADRKVAAYSKGMRQRIKLAQALCHQPTVLVLDEPLNGLDPMARAEMIEVFQLLSEEGRHVIISSHILHEVDLISDQVILLNEGYVVAEGGIRSVRNEMEDRPLQIIVRCDKPSILAARIFEQDSAVEVKLHKDRAGLLVSTSDAEKFYLMLNEVVLAHDLRIEAVTPADEDVHAVYEYLIGNQGDPS